MIYEAATPEEYLEQLPKDRRDVIEKLRKTIKENIGKEFEETMSYNMISYVVPHSIYPPGYHVTPSQSLPFISIASQKNYVAIYHMGIYMFSDVLEWFEKEYPKHMKTKLDMGKSCIKFRNMNTIPFDLIGELCRKISLRDYVDKYEKSVK